MRQSKLCALCGPCVLLLLLPAASLVVNAVQRGIAMVGNAVQRAAAINSGRVWGTFVRSSRCSGPSGGALTTKSHLQWVGMH